MPGEYPLHAKRIWYLYSCDVRLMQVTGWSETDELPEAVEHPGRRFALGVQWHPEADETSRLIAALVAEASAHRAAAAR